MIVRARRTSPPSRCTCARRRRRSASIARVTRISAPEPARLLQRAARELVARHAGREAEVVLDPRRRAGLAAGRLALDDDRAQALRRAVDGRREPGRARRRRSPCRTRRPSASVPRPSSSATRRQRGRITVLPPTTRIAGQSSSAGSGPPQRSAASGASGRDPRERDLVAVEEAPQLGARRRPSGARRRSRAAAAARRRCPAGRAGRSIRARQPADLLARCRAPPRRPRGSRAARCACTRDGSAARKPTGNTVPSAIGTSPKMSPGSRWPTTRSMPSIVLDGARCGPRARRTARARRPRGAAYSPGGERDVGRGARQPLALSLAERREQRDRGDLVGGDHRADATPLHRRRRSGPATASFSLASSAPRAAPRCLGPAPGGCVPIADMSCACRLSSSWIVGSPAALQLADRPLDLGPPRSPSCTICAAFALAALADSVGVLVGLGARLLGVVVGGLARELRGLVGVGAQPLALVRDVLAQLGRLLLGRLEDAAVERPTSSSLRLTATSPISPGASDSSQSIRDPQQVVTPPTS